MANSLNKLTLADLVLIRLAMPTKTPPSPAAILKDLGPMINPALTKERLKSVLDDFRSLSKGYLPVKGQQLTDQGRQAALTILGRTELPPKCNWGTIKAKFLIPQAFGLTPWSEAEIKRVDKAEKLAARLLIQHKNLPIKINKSLTQVATHLLGIDEGVNALRGLVLKGQILDVINPQPQRSDAGHPNSTEHILKPEQSDLFAFAESVLEAAKTCPTGWIGDQLVLISHVWKHYVQVGGTEPLDAFKIQLAKAYQARFLTLTRADLAQSSHAEDIQDSEVKYGLTTYHFIHIVGGR